ncbi:MAG: outer membrane protein assembly factor BamA, partial [Treponema sp.]|nr:outer membrane protein assembly factor BamA [Treponema sp.]
MRFDLTRAVFLACAVALATAAAFAQEGEGSLLGDEPALSQAEPSQPAEASEDWYLGRPIREIAFSGLSNVRLADLEGITRPFIGRVFDYGLFWEIQGALWALDFFEMITPVAERGGPAGDEVILRFAVTERPVISRIVFTGNSAIRRSVLLDTISTNARDMANPARIRLDEAAIVSRYLERGYPDVRVTSEVQLVGNNNVLTFSIVEGEMISIQEIVFEGNSAFSERTLRRQLSLRPRGLFNSGAFHEAGLLADIAALTMFYRERGYIDAEVVDVARDLQRDDRGSNNLTLTFNISEGQQHTFGGIAFEGNHIFTDAQLHAQVRSRQGEIVNAARVMADLERIADMYFEHGYIFNLISPQERRDPTNNVVYYHVSIVERGRAHIESISVIGNTRTRTDVILREIPLVPGDVFSRTRVLEGWHNLMNLRYFSMVIPETPPGSADGLMDLVFVVEEQQTTELQLGVTIAGTADPNAFPISVMASLNDINFLGSGNQFGFSVTASPDTARGSVMYNRRWLFGLPLTGGFDFSVDWSRRNTAMNNSAPFFNGDEPWAFPDGFVSREEYIAANRIPPNEFMMRFQQLSLSLGFSTSYRWMTPAGILSVGGGVRGGMIRVMYDDTIYRPFDPALREGNNTWTPITSVWTSLSLDTRDLFFDPTRGYFASTRMALNGILGNEREHYMRSDSNAQFFHTLFDIPVSDSWNFRMTLGLYAGLSFVFPQPGRDLSVEEANKLAIDGMFVARGWGSEFRNKGLLLWNNWAELRMPIVPRVLAWDFFLDAAGVETEEGLYFSSGNFGIENMRFSLGGG